MVLFLDISEAGFLSSYLSGLKKEKDSLTRPSATHHERWGSVLTLVSPNDSCWCLSVT